MANHKSILLPILSSFNDKGVRSAQSALGGLGESIKKAAKGFLAYQAIAGSVSFATNLIDEANALQKSVYGLNTVFGMSAGAMADWAKGASSFGLSTADASKSVTFLGTVLRSAGFDMQTTMTETQKLTALASDLALTYGYDVQEALTGMSALFRGEYDPIEKFGVAMKQSEVNAVMAARGMGNLTGAAQRNAMAQVRLELLYQRTADAQGAYSRSAGSLFVAQNNLIASFKNMQAEAGKPFLQPLADFFAKIQGSINVFQADLISFMTSLSQYVEPIGRLFMSLGDLLGTFLRMMGQANDMSAPVWITIIDSITNVIETVNTLIIRMQSFLEVILTFGAAWAIFKIGVGVFEAVSAGIAIAKAAMEAYRMATMGATVWQLALDAALGPAGWVALGAGLVAVTAAMVITSNATENQVTVQNRLNKSYQATVDYLSQIHNYRYITEGSNKVKTDKQKPAPNSPRPLNPKPGEVYTFYKSEGGLYVWYQQVWNGTSWSKAKKMTYTDTTTTTNVAETLAEKRRKKEKARLDAQKKAYDDLAKSVRDSFKSIQDSLMGAFDISEMGSSAGRVMANVRRLIEQTKKFAESIRSLQAQNLNGDLLNQLIAAGPVAAGRLAANLASSGLAGELNAAYSEYGGLATGIAGYGVQGMYGAGSSQYNITVNAGLGSKEQIAKAVVEAIKYYEKNNGGKK